MTRRLIFLMIALELIIFHLMYDATIFPLLAAAVAGFGLLGGPRFDAPRRRQGIYALALLLPFVAQWQFLPFSSPTVNGPLAHTVTYVFVQYFITLQIMELLLRKKRVSAAVPLYGVLAATCSGNVFVSPRQSVVYGVLCLILLGLSVVYLRARAGQGGGKSSRRRRPALAPVAALLIVAGVSGMILSGILYSNQLYMARVFVEMFAPQFALSGAGFSEKAKLGSVIRLKRPDIANKTALRVFSKVEPGYLRGRAFDYYGLNSEWKDMSSTVGLAMLDRPPGVRELGPEQRYFQLRNNGRRPWASVEVWPSRDIVYGVFGPKEAAVIAAPVTKMTLDSNGTADSVEISEGVNYTWFVPDRAADEVLSQGDRKRFTDVPVSLDPRIVQLARSVFADCTTPLEKMHAVAAHFVNNYDYDTGIRIPAGQDPVTHFLLERPAAHCEYFAAGAALLLRIGGVPTRYVTGFVASEWNPIGGYWMARNEDAHAWVEAYDHATGWQIVEATPPSGTPAGDAASTADYLADLASFRIQELQVRTYLRGVAGLFAWLGARAKSLVALAASNSPGMLALKACLLILFVRFIWRRVRSRRPARAKDPSVRALHALLARADAGTRKLGLTREPDETLHQFARRIAASIATPGEAAPIAEWYAAYAAVRYSGVVADADIEQLQQTLRSADKGCHLGTA